MGNIWFTADQHYGHKNIIKYCNRPFRTVKDMDEILIAKHNSVVSKDDFVFVVGDFSLKNPDNYVHRLNGNIALLKGGHDSFGESYNSYSATNNDVAAYPALYELKKEWYNLPHTIVLCHYAMRSWNQSHYGSWHLFGHHHGKLEPYGLSFDIGVDCWDYYPVSLEQVEAKMKTLKPIVDFSKK